MIAVERRLRQLLCSEGLRVDVIPAKGLRIAPPGKITVSKREKPQSRITSKSIWLSNRIMDSPILSSMLSDSQTPIVAVLTPP